MLQATTLSALQQCVAAGDRSAACTVMLPSSTGPYTSAPAPSGGGGGVTGNGCYLTQNHKPCISSFTPSTLKQTSFTLHPFKFTQSINSKHGPARLLNSYPSL